MLFAIFPISNNDSRSDKVSAREPYEAPSLPNMAISLDPLISRLPSKTKTTFIKISPDINDRELDDICNIVLDSAKIDGLILTNTTISRQNLYSKPIKNSWKIDETGGLSGPPLRGLSNKIINRVYKKTKGKIILIGVGGVSSGKDAFEKISLGAF